MTLPLQMEKHPKNDLSSRTVTSSSADPSRLNANLAWVISAHGLLRIASGTSGILIGLYLASLNNHGAHLSAGLVGTLSAVSFAAELFASIPMGLASDAMQPRSLMTAGAIVGAVAVFLFAMSGQRPSSFSAGCSKASVLLRSCRRSSRISPTRPMAVQLCASRR